MESATSVMVLIRQQGVATMYRVAKKKSQSESTDRHKPRVMVGLPLKLAGQLEILCERNCSNRTDEVIRAVRLLLEQEGLWPIPKDESQD